MNYRVLQEDVEQFVEHFELREELHEKSFLITGATGLIGSILVKCLMALKENIHITIPVRDLEKAKIIFGDEIGSLNVQIVSSLKEWSGSQNDFFDYIIHCASPTAGKFMEEHPVETLGIAYDVTFNLLQLAKTTKASSFVFVSSLEYYGQFLDDRLLDESMQGYLDPMSARSSYPMGKRIGEYLCYAFASEYDVPAKAARLTQTFGAGISENDNRVFAQFARSVIEKKDIILHTRGDSAKPYCYTTDCISAILYILLRGVNGNAYNVANEDTYISIRDLAMFMKENFNPQVNVKIELNDNMGYAPVTKLHLSSNRLKALGWKPRYELKRMFERLIMFLKD